MIALELSFGAALVVWLALTAGPGHPLTRETALVTGLLALVLHVTRDRDGLWWLRGRYVARYGFVLWAYLATARLVPALGRPIFDAELLALDRRLFGETPSVRVDLAGHPVLTEVLSSAYLTYQPYLHICLLWALAEPRERAPRIARLVFTTLVLGYVGYLLVPAVGPFAFIPAHVAQPLVDGPIAAFNIALVQRGGAVFDVFPSLHTAVTLVLLAHDRAWVPRRFVVMAPIGALLIGSTVLLRFHYAIDLVAGIFLAAGVIVATGRKTLPSAASADSLALPPGS